MFEYCYRLKLTVTIPVSKDDYFTMYGLDSLQITAIA